MRRFPILLAALAAPGCNLIDFGTRGSGRVEAPPAVAYALLNPGAPIPPEILAAPGQVVAEVEYYTASDKALTAGADRVDPDGSGRSWHFASNSDSQAARDSKISEHAMITANTEMVTGLAQGLVSLAAAGAGVPIGGGGGATPAAPLGGLSMAQAAQLDPAVLAALLDALRPAETPSEGDGTDAVLDVLKQLGARLDALEAGGGSPPAAVPEPTPEPAPIDVEPPAEPGGDDGP